MGYLDRGRAAGLLADAGIDALVVLSPENFAYVTGAGPGPVAMWRRAGGAVALVPADAGAAPAAVVPDSLEGPFRAATGIADVRTHVIWMDALDLDADAATAAGPDLAARVAAAARRAGRPQGLTRPATYEPRRAFALLRETLAERGLLRARLGVELDFVPVADFALLRDVVPEAEWVDSGPVFERLRAVKTTREIDRLRTALELSETGLAALARAIAPGAGPGGLARTWRDAATEAASAQGAPLTGSWHYISVGPDPWSATSRLAPGGLVKADVGCVVDGYSSDCARTFVLGAAPAAATAVYGAMRDAWETGRAELRPGRLLSDVHRATTAAMRRAGFPDYARGHFGHSVGAMLSIEEWPYIAADSAVAIEPGMVLSYEIPWYLGGLGAFMLEDQFLITGDGAESMNRLPRDLVAVAG